jgi:hypothetical protein
MKILALDLGKFNTMCCFFDSKTHKSAFLTAATDRNFLTTATSNSRAPAPVNKSCYTPFNWSIKLAATLSAQHHPKETSLGRDCSSLRTPSVLVVTTKELVEYRHVAVSLLDVRQV